MLDVVIQNMKIYKGLLKEVIKINSIRHKVLNFLNQEIEDKKMPGASILIAKKQKVLVKEFIGKKSTLEHDTNVDEHTLYDIASLTKVVATLPSILKLIDDGECHLFDKVQSFIPEFRHSHITIYHLLTHTSGLPAHRPYYLEKLNKEDIISEICREELSYSTESKVVYSDLGFILLSKIVENITGKTFSDFVSEEVFEKLDMHDTFFVPNISKSRFAPTEFDSRINQFKRGIVHDENAEAMGGISGHAGLFSTLNDLYKYAQMVEMNGEYCGNKIISNSSMNISKHNFTKKLNTSRGLGWEINTNINLQCGQLFSKDAYGHTGFTGTSMYFDPSIELVVILLTNRVFFGRENVITNLRPRLHNLIRAEIENL